MMIGIAMLVAQATSPAGSGQTAVTAGAPLIQQPGSVAIGTMVAKPIVVYVCAPAGSPTPKLGQVSGGQVATNTAVRIDPRAAVAADGFKAAKVEYALSASSGTCLKKGLSQ